MGFAPLIRGSDDGGISVWRGYACDFQFVCLIYSSNLANFKYVLTNEGSDANEQGSDQDRYYGRGRRDAWFDCPAVGASGGPPGRGRRVVPPR